MIAESRDQQSDSGSPGPAPGRICFLTIAVMVVAGAVFLWEQFDLQTVSSLLCPSSLDIRMGRWDGLLGSVFMHGDIMHIAFNLCWVWVFGRVLEVSLGPVFWILLFLTCAAVASASELAWSDRLGIGLSGVVYGWFGFIWFTRFKYPIFHSVINQRTALWLAGWLVFCFFLSNIANGAHVGGLVAGSLIGLAASASIRRAVVTCILLLGLVATSLLYAPWSASFNIAGAMEALKREDYDRARLFISRVPEREPAMRFWKAATIGDICLQQGDYHAAAAAYGSQPEFLAKDADVLNRYAWLLATCPDESVRDGRKAVDLASRAVNLTQGKNYAILDTLAAAYAETGDFDAAVAEQSKAVAGLADDKDVAARLDLYRQRKPYRDSFLLRSSSALDQKVGP